MENVAGTKDAIRKRIREQGSSLDSLWVRQNSTIIVSRLVRRKQFADALVVGCYLSLPREVQTMELIYLCWDSAKSVCVPAWDAGSAAYRMARFSNAEEMVSGPAGILQPRRPEWVAPAEIRLMIVPGVAFGPGGGRIGHGGGHYDRMLAGCPGFKAGVAFDFQMLEMIPQGEHDVPVDVVVTERMTYE